MHQADVGRWGFWYWRAKNSNSKKWTIHYSDPPSAKKKRNLGSMFKADKYQDQERSLLSVEQRIITELNCFEKALLLDTEEDPLSWWKFQSHSFHILSKFSKKISGFLCNKCCLWTSVQYFRQDSVSTKSILEARKSRNACFSCKKIIITYIHIQPLITYTYIQPLIAHIQPLIIYYIQPLIIYLA